MSTLTFSDVPLSANSPAERLRKSAAAVRVHFTWWGTHRTLTAQQKEEVGLTYSADSRLLTAGKKLIDTRHDAFRKLTAVRTRIASYWRGMTLPYTEPGVRLIRQSDIAAFDEKMQTFRDELRDAERGLNDIFTQVKADARRRLGRLYDSHDYPDVVHGLFAVSWDFPAIEPPGYLMRLHPDLYQQEQQRVADRFAEAVTLAEQAFTAEFAKLVQHLASRLQDDGTGEQKIFRDSAVTNLLNFFERFRHLSIQSNEDLEKLVAQAQELIQGVTPNALRTNADLRQQIAGEMAHVQTALDGMLIDRPRRRILRMSAESGGSNGTAH